MSVRETVEERLARIAEGAPAVFPRLYAEQARAAADAADARRRDGISLGPLDGAMVSIKDLFDVAGETTRAGSILLADAAPARTDAPVVARLRRAGAVILGKTNMSEFAFSGLGLNPHYGTPGNAADPACIPGGSSSGAGVSVGQGTSDIAIGSDTGGSVRIPASLNGVVGFKPTARRVPLEGAFPLSYALDSLGPLARTVADCAAADAVMAGEGAAPLEARGAEFLSRLDPCAFGRVDGVEGVEAPVRLAGDEDDAPGIGHEGDLAGGAPSRLDRVELDLHHHHAGPGPDPAREVQARPTADCSQGELGSGPAGQSLLEIGAETVVPADEAAILPRVARRDRETVGADDVDDRRSGGGRDLGEPPIDTIQEVASGIGADRGGDLGVGGER